jgi:hypothetical protein
LIFENKPKKGRNRNRETRKEFIAIIQKRGHSDLYSGDVKK